MCNQPQTPVPRAAIADPVGFAEGIIDAGVIANEPIHEDIAQIIRSQSKEKAINAITELLRGGMYDTAEKTKMLADQLDELIQPHESSDGGGSGSGVNDSSGSSSSSSRSRSSKNKRKWK